MQDRMQGNSALLNFAYTALFRGLLPLAQTWSRSLRDRRRGWVTSDAIADAFLALHPSYQKALRGNAAQVLGCSPEKPRAEILARAASRNHLRGWVDFFHFGPQAPEVALAHLASFQGEQHLREAMAQGRGVILLTAHAGNFELGALLLRVWGLQIHTVYKPDRFPAVERLRASLRTQGGVVGIPVGEGPFTTLPLVGHLRQGHLVGMQGDRDFNLNGLPLPFLGREAYFPRGPWELSAMTSAPVVVSFFRTDDAGDFHAEFFEPIRVAGDRASRDAAMRQGMARYVALLESLIRRHPEQWNCFYPFWDDPLRKA